MKVLITNPFCWPYVRRGSERFLHELAHFLADRGHVVSILSSKPGPEDSFIDGAVHVTRKRQRDNRWLRRLRLSPDRVFAASVFQFLRNNRFDAVVCLHFWDACGVVAAKLFQSQPFVYYLTGIPWGPYFRRRPMDNLAFRLTLRNAASVIGLSRSACEYLSSDFGHHAIRLPIPCDLTRFPLSTGRDLKNPRILAAGAFSEPRKGARVLARAFATVKRTVPAARLQYSGEMPDDVRTAVLDILPNEWRQDVEFLGVGKVEDLPTIYGSAAVTVLPSVWEAFGMVLTESLACGTPVVGTRHGGIPDIVDDGVGFLFDPGETLPEATNAASLADAILSALGLYAGADIAARCRARAERFGWAVLGPELERVIADAAGVGLRATTMASSAVR